MSTEAATPLSLHATAVAIGRRGLLILGGSRAGKSRLAYALLAATSPNRTIELIGDDRILLAPSSHGGYLCRPHPRIAGFIERRGLGIVALPFVDRVPLAAAVALDVSACLPAALAPENFPVLSLVTCSEATARRDRVLGWWADVQNRGTCTTPRQESACEPAERLERLELVTATRSYISASRGDEAVRSN